MHPASHPLPLVDRATRPHILPNAVLLAALLVWTGIGTDSLVTAVLSACIIKRACS